MVVEGFITMIDDISSVAHQALASGGGGGAVAYNAALGNTWGPSGASLNASATGTNNVALGANAMMSTTTGNANTAIGYSALRDNTTGIRNIGVGPTALRENEIGSFNTAVGYGAIVNLVDCSHNVAIGYSALAGGVGSWARSNVAIGSEAMRDVSGGYRNVAIGDKALFSASGGWGNIAIGYEAMKDVSSSLSCWSGGSAPCTNIAIGYRTMMKVGSQNSNLAIGQSAMQNTTTGSNNVAIGNSTLFDNTTGIRNVAVGCCALRENEGGSSSTGVGYSALFNMVDGSFNAAFGAHSLESLTSGSKNTAIGGFAGGRLGDGSGNVAIGYEAMWGATNPTNNIWGCVAVGYEAGRYIRSFGQVAIGNRALRAGGTQAVGTNTNVAVGQKAMELLGQDGSGGNVALGGCALCASVSGGWNTALGNGALSDNTDGNNNVGVGCSALASLISGSNNTALGHYAGLGMSNNNFDGLLILNATGGWFPTGLSADVSNSFFVKPVREASQTNALYYNPTSGEVTHSGAGSAFSSGGHGSKWITATDASNNGWNAHPYGGSGLGTSPVSLGTLTGLHESDILAAFASGTRAMRARITIYGAGGGGGAGSSTSASSGGGKNGAGGGSGAMFTFVNYDVSATLWDNSAGLLALAGGGAGGRPDQITWAQSPYGGEGGRAGGGPPLLAAQYTGGTNAGSQGTNTSSPAGYMPSFYDAIWNSSSNPTYPHAYGVGGGGGGRGGSQWDQGANNGGGKGWQNLDGAVVTAPTMYNGWVAEAGASIRGNGEDAASFTGYGTAYPPTPGGAIVGAANTLQANAWRAFGGGAGSANWLPNSTWSYPALPGGDGRFGAGGGGGGASFSPGGGGGGTAESGKHGGKGGDALMIIEWWL